jgi:hypothetical protein
MPARCIAWPILLLSIALFASVCLALPAAAMQGDLLLVGGERMHAELVGVVADSFKFRTATGDELAIDQSRLIRFAHPPQVEPRAVVSLADGSHLVVAPLWVGRAPLALDSQQLSLRGNTFRQFSVSRTQLSRVVMAGHAIGKHHEANAASSVDRLWLDSGDRLDGKLLEISQDKMVLQLGQQSVPVAIDRVAAVQLADTKVVSAEPAKYAIWLADGTRLQATGASQQGESIEVRLVSGAIVRLKSLSQIVAIVGYPESVHYLSDLEAVDYKQTPYFELGWPYERDKNLSGAPLSAGGRQYAKGIAVHSASRLAYRVPAAANVLRAELAIDGSASRLDQPGQGSVVFRVYLVKDGQLTLAYESPIVRGDEAPLAIEVALEQSPLIVLLVDYADRGDEWDHANWLDARLENGN